MENPEEKKRRINGFERPWHEFQLITWIIFPLIIIYFYSFLIFLIWKDMALFLVLVLIFSIFAFTTFLSDYLICTIDPCDDALESKDKSGHQEVNSKDDENEQIYCYLCETNVHHTSKHCRYCNKCIVGFDHHCLWLNTCIGKKNYKYFLLLLLSVFIIVAESFSISVSCLIEAYAYQDSFHHRLYDSSGKSLSDLIGSSLSLDAIRGILIGSIVFHLGLLLMILQLGCFHIVLISKGLTTYDFIVQEQKKQRDREYKKMERQLEKQEKKKKAKSKSFEEINDNKSISESNDIGEKHTNGTLPKDVELANIYSNEEVSI